MIELKKKQSPVRCSRHVPLHCWDVVSAQHKSDLHERAAHAHQNVLSAIFDKQGWELDLDILFKETYEAVVLTNREQQILWVSEGFREMTGYSPSFALGRKPSFLQGKNTTDFSRKAIASKLALGMPFSDRIVNYKKDHTEYICEVNIYPVRDFEHGIAAFLALESEVF